VIGGCYR